MSETPNLCACGCGEIANVNAHYIRGHHLRIAGRIANAKRHTEAELRRPMTPPIAMVEDEELPISAPINVWRGIVAVEFLFSYNDMLLKFQPGQIVVDTPLYQHLQANHLPVLWMQ